MFKGKPTRVIITGDAKKEFNKLNKIIRKERANGIKSSDHQTLLNSIKKKISILKNNPEYGIHISKKKIPKRYIYKYDVSNLWKINLCGAWRMIYTIVGDKIEIISLILDIMNHKDYDKRFGYKKQ